MSSVPTAPSEKPATTIAGMPEPSYSGVVPPCMSFIADWHERLTTIELYFDSVDEVGYLLLLARSNPDSHVATLCSSGDELNFDWRGAAADLPEDWRVRQELHVAQVLARRKGNGR